MLRRLFIPLLLLSFCPGWIGTARTSRPVAIRCGRLIDAGPDQRLLKTTNVTQNERVAAIGENVAVPAVAQD